MTSDDQQFLDIVSITRRCQSWLANGWAQLSSIHQDVRNFTAGIFDATDRHLEVVAGGIRDFISSMPWIPQSVKPLKIVPPPAVPETLYGRATGWISRHKAMTVAVLAFFGTGAVLIYTTRRAQGKKRRAKRAKNGARKEVVVIAGPPVSPITKSLTLDLERRGFIVYCIVRTQEDEQLVQNESRMDLRPFHLDLVEPLSTQMSMERFNNLLSTKHHAFNGAAPHELSFAGLIIVPDFQYPSGPIETLSAEIWSDTIDTKVLKTIATVQAFLPTVCEFKSRILVLTPSIVSSLRPPFHAIENTVVSALDGFTTTLRRELSTLGIPVVSIKLGSFDCSNHNPKNALQPISESRTYAWPPSARNLYAQNFITQTRVAESRGLFGETGGVAKGSSLKKLHHAVFDALTAKSPWSTWRVGRGSVQYDIIGRYIPASIIGWMLGLRRVSLAEIATPQQVDEAAQAWEKVEHSGSV